jgi:ABC-type Zn uptake system ZnuABC Zn-binding protein ZnuA
MKNQIAMLFFCLVLLCTVSKVQANKEDKIFLCTTFPIFQITRNIVGQESHVQVQLLLPAALGCPHDYALTPQDMQNLLHANALIVNGLGMEEFLGALVNNANPDLTVIDSSTGITEFLKYTDPDGDDHGHHDGEVAGKGHDHDHTGPNPHLFTSPRQTARLATNIAAALAKFDPAHARAYLDNGRAYALTMTRLADELTALGKRLANNRIVTQHGIFDYLARDMGLEVVAVVQAHPGQEPSAAEMLDLIKTAKEKKAGAVFTEPQYPPQVGQTIAREAGIAVAPLDPAASGPEMVALDYYETVMHENMKTLEHTLGVR